MDIHLTAKMSVKYVRRTAFNAPNQNINSIMTALKIVQKDILKCRDIAKKSCKKKSTSK
jgi:hypothetical protein